MLHTVTCLKIDKSLHHFFWRDLARPNHLLTGLTHLSLTGLFFFFELTLPLLQSLLPQNPFGLIGNVFLCVYLKEREYVCCSLSFGFLHWQELLDLEPLLDRFEHHWVCENLLWVVIGCYYKQPVVEVKGSSFGLSCYWPFVCPQFDVVA